MHAPFNVKMLNVDIAMQHHDFIHDHLENILFYSMRIVFNILSGF